MLAGICKWDDFSSVYYECFSYNDGDGDNDGDGELETMSLASAGSSLVQLAFHENDHNRESASSDLTREHAFDRRSIAVATDRWRPSSEHSMADRSAPGMPST